ncbi:MAG: DUF2278 family protein [Akkermansiaceae bacterium]
MSSVNYGRIAGSITRDFERGEHPHLYIYLDVGDGIKYKVAVNVEDFDGSEVFFSHIKNLDALFLKELQDIENGVEYIERDASSGALDYIRGGFIKPEQFTQVSEPELTQSLIQTLKPYINADDGSKLIAFGSRFPDGIHDIHMNQGYPSSKDISYQDGALILYDGKTGAYEGLFFHFHVQSFDRI